MVVYDTLKVIIVITYCNVLGVEVNWLRIINSKQPSFCRDGIFKLPEKWQKVVSDNGNYFDR
ncbi:hypothetical protein WH47_01045 [Habropoda laboriosa]|uniref:Uncharacterized protein n=1 Tax=Habropoda laboriosa TaxID=597456 RepID=A0A0L7R0Y9_9HYME|nr:hypothetical protein WH47_01045 [Habropoda laboriosa]